MVKVEPSSLACFGLVSGLLEHNMDYPQVNTLRWGFMSLYLRRMGRGGWQMCSGVKRGNRKKERCVVCL